jgi:hypothetical protein
VKWSAAARVERAAATLLPKLVAEQLLASNLTKTVA